MKWVENDARRRAVLVEHADDALVSVELPLRANLSALENIAIGLQFREDISRAAAAERGWELLRRLDRTAIAARRDPDLDCEGRFVTKLLRVLVLRPALIVIDRPVALLPDVPAPAFLRDTLGRLAGHYQQCCVVEYEWNRPLYTYP